MPEAPRDVGRGGEPGGCETDERPADTTGTLSFAWDDHLVVRLGDQAPLDLSDHALFRAKTIRVPRSKGRHPLCIVLSNTRGSHHGG